METAQAHRSNGSEQMVRGMCQQALFYFITQHQALALPFSRSLQEFARFKDEGESRDLDLTDIVLALVKG